VHTTAYVERLVDLIDPNDNLLLNMTPDEAAESVASGDPERIRAIDGQFAIVPETGQPGPHGTLHRPSDAVLPGQAGRRPCLIVAERMEEILEQLQKEGLEDQFHPSYTRDGPGAIISWRSALVGCPDPNPVYTRFFNPHGTP